MRSLRAAVIAAGLSLAAAPATSDAQSFFGCSTWGTCHRVSITRPTPGPGVPDRYPGTEILFMRAEHFFPNSSPTPGGTIGVYYYLFDEEIALAGGNQNDFGSSISGFMGTGWIDEEFPYWFDAPPGVRPSRLGIRLVEYTTPGEFIDGSENTVELTITPEPATVALLGGGLLALGGIGAVRRRQRA